MDKRLAALPLLLLAGTALPGCVAAVIPAIAGSTMVGKRVLDEGQKPDAEPSAAPTPVAVASPAPVATRSPPAPAPAPMPEPVPVSAPVSEPVSEPAPAIPVAMATPVPAPAPPPPPPPAPAATPAPAPAPSVTSVVVAAPSPPPPALLPSAPAASPNAAASTIGPLAPYPDPARPIPPEQAHFARFVRYGQVSARQSAQGLALPSAILSDPTALDGKRRRCAVGEQLVVVIDLDPAGGLFAPPANPSTIPGLAYGLALLRQEGIEIAWMSDLSTNLSGAVRTALEQSGLDPRGEDIISLSRDVDDLKDQRRNSLAGIACIVAIAGDERPDFDLRFKYLKNPEAGAGLEPLIGDGWFLTQPLLGK